MNRSNLAIALAVVAVVVSLAVGLFWKSPTPAVQSPLGGLVHNIREDFSSGINSGAFGAVGGDSLTAISSGSIALAARDICGKTLVTQNVGTKASMSATAATRFPSGTSIINNCLPNKGDWARLFYINTSVDDNLFLKFDSNAFLDTYYASGSNTTLEIGINRGVLIDMFNVDGSSISMMLQEFKDSQ